MCFARNLQQFSKILCFAIFTIWLPLCWSRGHQLFWNSAGKDRIATKYHHHVVLTLTGGLRACTLCCCPTWELCRSFDPQLATVLMGTLKAFVLPVPPPALGFRGLCLMPSSSLTSKILLGSSSTLQSTKVLHSGHRSSFRELTMPSRQRLQNVCWQGKTFAEASRRSKQTGHSNRSSKADSSIFFVLLNQKTNLCRICVFWALQGYHVTSIPLLTILWNFLREKGINKPEKESARLFYMKMFI